MYPSIRRHVGITTTRVAAIDQSLVVGPRRVNENLCHFPIPATASSVTPPNKAAEDIVRRFVLNKDKAILSRLGQGMRSRRPLQGRPSVEDRGQPAERIQARSTTTSGALQSLKATRIRGPTPGTLYQPVTPVASAPLEPFSIYRLALLLTVSA